MKMSSNFQSSNGVLRCYSELITLPTYIERFNYLKLGGKVGADSIAISISNSIIVIRCGDPAETL